MPREQVRRTIGAPVTTIREDDMLFYNNESGKIVIIINITPEVSTPGRDDNGNDINTITSHSRYTIRQLVTNLEFSVRKTDFETKYTEIDTQIQEDISEKLTELIEANEQPIITDFDDLVELSSGPEVDYIHEREEDEDTRTDEEIARDSMPAPGNIFVPNTEFYNLDNITLDADVMYEVKSVMNRIVKRETVVEHFEIGKFEENTNKLFVNLYGVPGTGKTKTIKTIASELDEEMLCIDYSAIDSKSAIKYIFEYAKATGYILYFDEGDTLMKRRENNASVNALRNVFMQEMDSFDGVIFVSTNLMNSLDDAIVSRIDKSIELDLPTDSARYAILHQFLNEERINALDKDLFLDSTLGMSGRDIKKLVSNCIDAVTMNDSSDDWNIDNETIVKQSELLIKANLANWNDEESADVGVLIKPDTSKYSMDTVILDADTKDEIMTSVNAIKKQKAMNEAFGTNIEKKNLLNFYGKSGTGKTLCAKSIATDLGLRLYQVDYSAIISKWVGDSGKHLKAMFKRAKASNAILFLDEGDSLMAKRMGGDGSGFSRHQNTNTNTFMQELDAFDGIVISTTNFNDNIDPAIHRRINRSVKFDLPNAELRKGLFNVHLPSQGLAECVDVNVLAAKTKSFGGGDISKVVSNAMETACLSDNTDEWVITQEILLKEIGRVDAIKSKNKTVEISI